MAVSYIKKAALDIGSRGEQLADNTNFNTLTRAGRYYSSSPSGLSNVPSAVNSAISIDVLIMDRAANIRCWQIIFAYSASNPRIYYRVMAGADSFSDWKLITAT